MALYFSIWRKKYLVQVVVDQMIFDIKLILNFLSKFWMEILLLSLASTQSNLILPLMQINDVSDTLKGQTVVSTR